MYRRASISLIACMTLLLAQGKPALGQACQEITAPQPLNSNAPSDGLPDLDMFPQIATDGAGNWVAVWETTDDLGGLLGDGFSILFSRSTDDGATWSTAAPLNSYAFEDGVATSARVTTDRAGNWVAVWRGWYNGSGGGSDGDIFFSRSTDNGATWTAALLLNTNAATDSGSDRYPQVTTDEAGTWVAVWESTDSLNGSIGEDWDILFSRSMDNGLTWTVPLPINTNAATDSGDPFVDVDRGPQLTTDGIGNWAAVWRSTTDLNGTIGTDSDILFALSTDKGAIWSDPAPLNTNAAFDSSGDAYPQVTTDGQGNWMAVWSSWDDLGGTIGTDADILFSRSTDNGTNWTSPAALNTTATLDGGNDVFPQLTTDGLGHWASVWQSETFSGDFDILFSISTDDGATWITPGALNTNAGTDPDDYYGLDRNPQLTTDGAGYWVGAWESKNTLDGTIGIDTDILTARFVLPDCNGNGVLDAQDIAQGTSEDGNANGIPDECEPDSDGDGVGDPCDNCELFNPDQSDCQFNGIGDVCDLADGTSDNCNENEVPDECEADCNGNAVPDDCDIAGGFSQDCNMNESPDECDIADGTSDDTNINGIPDECDECLDDSGCANDELCAYGVCVPDPACVDEDGDGKLAICHVPSGSPENARTISVSVKAVPAHLAHGDYCGPCGEPCEDVGCIVVQDNTDAYNPPGTRSCNILLHINAPGESLLAVGNANITTSDPSGFFQHEWGSDVAPNVLLVEMFPELAHDSYVDIGIEIDSFWGLDGTGLTADWDTCAFNCTEEACPPPPAMCCTGNTLCGQVLGGWFNSEPPNGQAIPDDEGNVFIAQFTVGAAHTVSGNVTVFVKGDFGLPPVPGNPDLDGNGLVSFFDVYLFFLAPWGPSDSCPPFVPEDLDQDCDIDIFDLAILLAAWGPVDGPVFANVVALPLSFECPGPSFPASQ